MAECRPVLVNLDTNQEIVGSVAAPDRLTQTQAVRWSHLDPRNAMVSKSDFLGAQAARFVVDMFFETAMPGKKPQDVRQYIKPLEALSKATERGFPVPCLLVWGTISIPVVLDVVTVVYLQFAAEGFPVRAQVRLQLSECRDQRKLRQAALKEGVRMGPSTTLAADAGVFATVGTAQNALTRTSQLASASAHKATHEVKSAANQVREEAEKLRADVDAEAKALEKGVKEAADEAQEYVDQKTEQIREHAEDALADVENEFKSVKSQIGELADGVGKEAKAAVASVRQGLAERIKEFVPQIQNFADRGFTEFRDKINQLAEELKTTRNTFIKELGPKLDPKARTGQLNKQLIHTAFGELDDLNRTFNDWNRTVTSATKKAEERFGDLHRKLTDLGNKLEGAGQESGDPLDNQVTQETAKCKAAMKSIEEDWNDHDIAEHYQKALDALNQCDGGTDNKVKNVLAKLRDSLSLSESTAKKSIPAFVRDGMERFDSLDGVMVECGNIEQRVRQAASSLRADLTSAEKRLRSQIDSGADQVRKQAETLRTDLEKQVGHVGKQLEGAKGNVQAKWKDLQKIFGYLSEKCIDASEESSNKGQDPQ